jgi:uncharacterized protein YggE
MPASDRKLTTLTVTKCERITLYSSETIQRRRNGMNTTRIRALIGLVVAGVIAAIGALVVISHPAAARGNVVSPLKAASTSHTVSVGGHGELSVPPDQATITLGVDTRASDAQSALSDNSSKMNAVITAVQGQGVPASHVQTSNLSIYYDSERNVYVASHQITAKLDDVNRVGQVLDAAVGAGANNTWGVGFGLKDPSAARAQALTQAVADARKRANAMASALGVTISGVGSASEATYQVTPVTYAAPSQAAAGAPTPVQPGQLTVTADINVVFTFG